MPGVFLGGGNAFGGVGVRIMVGYCKQSDAHFYGLINNGFRCHRRIFDIVGGTERMDVQVRVEKLRSVINSLDIVESECHAFHDLVENWVRRKFLRLNNDCNTLSLFLKKSWTQRSIQRERMLDHGINKAAL